MRVAVTGSQGLTCVSVLKELRRAGHETIGIDIKPAAPDKPDHLMVDLTDAEAVREAFDGAEAVVHFGSLAGDGSRPWDEVYRNIALGGLNVFQACSDLGIKRIAHASSPSVYGLRSPPEHVPLDEDHPQAPVSMYGAAKQNLESLAANYVRWNDLAIAAFRPCRIVYEGSFDWRFRHFTESDEAAANVLWSYVDARDVAAACRLWIESDLDGFRAFNLAADDVCVDTPTRELVARFLPPETEIRASLEAHTGLISCERAKELLGWRPQYSWRDLRREAEED